MKPEDHLSRNTFPLLEEEEKLYSVSPAWDGSLSAQPHRLAATRDYITRIPRPRQTIPTPGVSRRPPPVRRRPLPRPGRAMTAVRPSRSARRLEQPAG